MKILVVEDEVFSRKKLQKMMESFGECEAVENGEDALKVAVSENPPDLILLDIMLPGMDGYEVCERLKADPNTKDIPVIFLSAHTEIDEKTRGFEKGAVDYITKPFHKAEAKARVKTHLALKKTREDLVAKISELDSLYQQLHRNYEIASKVFSNIVRKDYRDRTDVKYLISPQEIVSGDLLLVSPKSTGGLYAFLGDFTGHGLSAAIGAIPASEVFYAMTAKNASIPDIVAEMNSRLKAVLPIGMFCCACVMELDHSSGRLTVWNGGMPDMLVVGRQRDIQHRLPFHAPALGVVGSDELDLDVEIIELAPQDRVYAYSDGITETANPDGEMFGRQRLEECLVQEYAHDNIFDEISSNLGAFRKDAPQSDDITMVEITYGQ